MQGPSRQHVRGARRHAENEPELLPSAFVSICTSPTAEHTCRPVQTCELTTLHPDLCVNRDLISIYANQCYDLRAKQPTCACSKVEHPHILVLGLHLCHSPAERISPSPHPHSILDLLNGSPRHGHVCLHGHVVQRVPHMVVALRLYQECQGFILVSGFRICRV